MEHQTTWLERAKWLLKRKEKGELPPWIEKVESKPGKKHARVRPIDVGGQTVNQLIARAATFRMPDGTSVMVAQHPELSSHQLADGVRSFLRRERKNPNSPYGIYKVKCHIIDVDAVRVTLSKEVPF